MKNTNLIGVEWDQVEGEIPIELVLNGIRRKGKYQLNWCGVGSGGRKTPIELVWSGIRWKREHQLNWCRVATEERKTPIELVWSRIERKKNIN